ncbi:STAS domain-containing protein [Phormidesmis sp. 146-35]
MDFSTKTINFPQSLDDASIAQFHHQIDGAVQSEANVLLVDFSEVKFMSSTGLMALVMAFKRVRSAQKNLFLTGVNEQVKMLLELTGMERVFEILEDSAIEEGEARSLVLAP